MKRIGVIAVALLLAFPVTAQVLNPTVGGFPVHCTDAVGAPVYTMGTTGFNDVAQSTIFPNGMRIIELNTQSFGGLPPLLKLFIYAHECGHHISGDIVAGIYFGRDNREREQNADRIGIRLMRDQLNITLAQANALAAAFANNPGMPPYYLPGPLRAQWIVACYRTSNDSCNSDIDYTSISSEEGGENENSTGAGDFCQILKTAIAASPNRFTQLRGKPASDYTLGWDATISLPGADRGCDIQRDPYTYFCRTPVGVAIDEIEQEVSECLSEWSRQDLHPHDGRRMYEYKNGGGTLVRISESKNDRIGISVQEDDD